MAEFEYTAKRAIKPGHSAGTDYTINIVLQQVDDAQPSPVSKKHKALSGTQVTVLHRVEVYISVVTDLVAVDGSGTPDVEDMAEFFHSVAGGETFTFDDGTLLTCIMEGKPQRQRQGIYFTYSFRFRVL